METQKHTTEIVFILDRSGSMFGLESDTIGGFNSMIEKQKKEDSKAYVTTILFDTDREVLHDRIELEKVPKMTNKDYIVGGSTALLDAVGETIQHISSIHRYIRSEDIPTLTLFVITTDGMENSSSKYNYTTVKKIIEDKKKLGWEFLFIGANIDAAAEAARIGISREKSANYVADGIGTAVVFDALTKSLIEMRTKGIIGNHWQSKIEADKKNRNN